MMSLRKNGNAAYNKQNNVRCTYWIDSKHTTRPPCCCSRRLKAKASPQRRAKARGRTARTTSTLSPSLHKTGRSANRCWQTSSMPRTGGQASHSQHSRTPDAAGANRPPPILTPLSLSAARGYLRPRTQTTGRLHVVNRDNVGKAHGPTLKRSEPR